MLLINVLSFNKLKIKFTKCIFMNLKTRDYKNISILHSRILLPFNPFQMRTVFSHLMRALKFYFTRCLSVVCFVLIVITYQIGRCSAAMYIYILHTDNRLCILNVLLGLLQYLHL